jgi:hypothetical protein
VFGQQRTVIPGYGRAEQVHGAKLQAADVLNIAAVNGGPYLRPRARCSRRRSELQRH